MTSLVAHIFDELACTVGLRRAMGEFFCFVLVWIAGYAFFDAIAFKADGAKVGDHVVPDIRYCPGMPYLRITAWPSASPPDPKNDAGSVAAVTDISFSMRNRSCV